MSAEKLRELLPIYPADSWVDDALCAQVDTELFFPSKGGDLRPARRVCRSCDVVDECREYAVENFIRDGLWGGTSPVDRRRIWRERRMTPPVLDEQEEVA